MNLAIAPAQHVRPHLAGVHLADVHALAPRAGVAHDHGAAPGAVPRAVAHPAEAGRVVKVVLLLAVGEELAREGELGERARARGADGRVALGAVEVAVEDAGVARGAEEDEGVGEGLEPVGHGRCEGLAGLSVVVHD